MKLTDEIIALADELGIEIPETEYEYEALASIAEQIGYNDYSYSPDGNGQLYNKLQTIKEEYDEDNTESSYESIDGQDEQLQEEYGKQEDNSDLSSEADSSSNNTNNRFSKNKQNNEENQLNNRDLRKNQYNKPGHDLNNSIDNTAEKIASQKAKDDVGKKVATDVTKKAGGEVGKKAASEAATKAAEQAAIKAGTEKAASAGWAALLKNPYFWLVCGIITLFVLMIVLVVILLNTSKGKGEYYEQFPYANLNVSEKVKVKIGNNIYELTLDEATAAVLEHEDTGLTKSMEYLKARAIASRSRIVYEMHQSSYKKDGYILSGGVLGFKRTSKNSKFQKAADETSGVILISGSVSNPKFACIEWDNICHSASKGGKETDNSFIVCQKKVEVPFSFLKKYSYYTIDHWRKQVGHGRGMSQWGAYYLAIEKDYDAVKLLNYFYDKNTIVTFYQPTSTTENKTSSGECKALSSISSTPNSAKKPTSPLKTLLKNKGTSVTSFNNGLLNAVLDAGSGTRCAVVTSAVYSIKNLASYGYRIPYSQPGYSVTHYGISGNWGQKACSGCKYDIKGLDCGTFVQWAFYNGGVNLGFNQFKNKGKNVGYTEGKPGDVLYYRSTDGHNGHVMLILKYNSKKKGYYVAQAAGKSYGNTKINFVNTSFLKNNNYKVKDMSSYYCAKSGCGKSKTKSNSQLKKAFN